MPQNPCPHWAYESDSRRVATLRAETASVLSDLKSGKIDAKTVIADSREVHKRLFSTLAPKSQSYLAGHYRGENFLCLKNCSVTIPSNPGVGCPPLQVRLELSKFDQISQAAIKRLDVIHAKPDDEIDATAKIIATVAVACRIFAQFLMIHPYANGNGHAGRIMLVALLGRYKYWPAKFSIEPRPFGRAYDEAIRAYQNGSPAELELLVMHCVAAP